MAKGVRVLELPADTRGGHALTSGHLLSAPPGCPFGFPGFGVVTEGRSTCTVRGSSVGGAGLGGEVGGPQGYGLTRSCASFRSVARGEGEAVAYGNGVSWRSPAWGPVSLALTSLFLKSVCL